MWKPCYRGLYTKLTEQLDGQTSPIEKQLDDQLRNPLKNILSRNVCIVLDQQMKNERTLMKLNIVFEDIEDKLIKELSIKSAFEFIQIMGDPLYTEFYFKLGNQTTNQIYARLNQQIRNQLSK